MSEAETSRPRPSRSLSADTNGVASIAPVPNAAVSNPRPAAPAWNTRSANTAASWSIGFARNATAKISAMHMRMAACLRTYRHASKKSTNTCWPVGTM